MINNFIDKNMNNSIVMVKGTSGCGKGTRLNQVILFLKSKGYVPEEVNYLYTNDSGKTKEIPAGIYFKELKIFVFGHYVISNKSGLESWTSLDSFASRMGAKSIDFMEEIIKRYDDTCFICDGNSITRSWRFRPANFIQRFGVRKIFMTYFYFENEKQYQTRIYNRSGEDLKDSSSGWLNNGQYFLEGKSLAMEREEINSKEEKRIMGELGVDNYKDLYSKLDDSGFSVAKFDAPITLVGELAFSLCMKNNDLYKEFLDYSVDHQCLRSVLAPRDYNN